MQMVSRDSSPTHYSVGKDIAGIVREVGNAVSTLKPGDEVVGNVFEIIFLMTFKIVHIVKIYYQPMML